MVNQTPRNIFDEPINLNPALVKIFKSALAAVELAEKSCLIQFETYSEDLKPTELTSGFATFLELERPEEKRISIKTRLDQRFTDYDDFDPFLQALIWALTTMFEKVPFEIDSIITEELLDLSNTKKTKKKLTSLILNKKEKYFLKHFPKENRYSLTICSSSSKGSFLGVNLWTHEHSQFIWPLTFQLCLHGDGRYMFGENIILPVYFMDFLFKLVFYKMLKENGEEAVRSNLVFNSILYTFSVSKAIAF
jgi:hypothetical protein